MYTTPDHMKSLYDFLDETEMIGVFDASKDPLTYTIITKIGAGTSNRQNPYIVYPSTETGKFTVLDEYKLIDGKKAMTLQYKDNKKLYYDGNHTYTWVSDVKVEYKEDGTTVGSITITTPEGETNNVYTKPLTEEEKEEMYSEYYDPEIGIGVKPDESGELKWYDTETGEEKDVTSWPNISYDPNSNTDPLADSNLIVSSGKPGDNNYYYAYPNDHNGNYIAPEPGAFTDKSHLKSLYDWTYDEHKIAVMDLDKPTAAVRYTTGTNTYVFETITNITLGVRWDFSQKYTNCNAIAIITTDLSGTTSSNKHHYLDKNTNTITSFNDIYWQFTTDQTMVTRIYAKTISDNSEILIFRDYDAEYVWYDINADIGIKKSTSTNVLEWYTDLNNRSSVFKDIKSWTWYSSFNWQAYEKLTDDPNEEQVTAAVSMDGTTWVYLYPRYHVNGPFTLDTVPTKKYPILNVSSLYDYIDNDLTGDFTKKVGMIKRNGEEKWYVAETYEGSALASAPNISESVIREATIEKTPLSGTVFTKISINNDEFILIEDTTVTNPEFRYSITDILHTVTYGHKVVYIVHRLTDAIGIGSISTTRYNWKEDFKSSSYTDNYTGYEEMKSDFYYSKSHNIGATYKIDMDANMVMYEGWTNKHRQDAGAWGTVFRYTAANKAKLDACTDIIKKNSYNNAKPMIVYLVNLQHYDAVNKRFFTNLKAKSLAWSYNDNGTMKTNQGKVIHLQLDDPDGLGATFDHYYTIMKMGCAADNTRYYVWVGGYTRKSGGSSSDTRPTLAELSPPIRIYTTVSMRASYRPAYVIPHVSTNSPLELPDVSMGVPPGSNVGTEITVGTINPVTI